MIFGARFTTVVCSARKIRTTTLLDALKIKTIDLNVFQQTNNDERDEIR